MAKILTIRKLFYIITLVRNFWINLVFVQSIHQRHVQNVHQPFNCTVFKRSHIYSVYTYLAL